MTANQTPAPSWIGRREVEAIDGALGSSAYVARAQLHARRHAGALPPWTRKLDDGRWQFDAAYIRADALENLRTVSVTEAAALLDTTRRTIQTWVDEGVIASESGPDRGKGETRRILREPFMRNLEVYRRRLAAPRLFGSDRPPVPTPPADPKARAALAVETQLRKSRTLAAAPKPAVVASPPKPDPAKVRAALQLEEQLRAAKDERRQTDHLRKHAEQVAVEILNDMLDDQIDRITAMTTFNQIAESEGVPADIRIAVRKEYFGH